MNMRQPGEVMMENRPPLPPSLRTETPTPPNSNPGSGRNSPMSGKNSPFRGSPAVERKDDISIAASGAMKGINRAQLTLQELQELAERQRQQILYNSKELMEKQQQLMQMHENFRNRMKVKKDETDSPSGKQQSRTEPSNSLPRSPKSPKSPKSPGSSGNREKDQYAKMLRQAYQNMGRLQQRNHMQTEVDIKKFNNIELAHELEKIRAIFKSKQNELAEAVKKVDTLTHELESRKNGESGWKDVPTPERINRRKKIQAAKDELDRLRNELIVRNEMNSQQSHQLQLQRDIIQEKQQELRQLNNRMNELGNALRRRHGSNSSLNLSGKVPNYTLINGQQPGLFARNYLHDTLNRKRSSLKYFTQDINGNDLTHAEPITPSSRPGSSTSGFESDDSRDSNRSTEGKSPYDNAPLNANVLWRNEPTLTNLESKLSDSSKLNKSSYSPSSSLSSLSSASSTTPDDISRPVFAFSNKDGPPPIPVRTTPVGVLINRNESQTKSSQNDFLSDLQKQQDKINRLQDELKSSKDELRINGSNNTETSLYNDASLVNGSDKLNDKYKQYVDANNSSSNETLVKNKKEKPLVKPKPQIQPKPVLEVRPIVQNAKPGVDQTDRAARPPVTFHEDEDVVIVPSASHLFNGHKGEEKDRLSEPSQSSVRNSPSEPDDFELSFADIDVLNETQTDLWSGTGSTLSQSSFDSESDDFDINVVPVLVSVPPESMPPPILMKPDKPRKPKRKLILDPFALLLDAALEGEMDTVVESLKKVPDPSKPNPEGITAIHNAVCGNHKKVVRFLVEVGCDINSADNNGWTPLHCAAFYNDTELCRFLVEHGASVYATTYTDYQTPAHKCSQLDDNYDECFGYLHQCKENVGRISNGLVHTLFDYTAESDDELNFRSGEELTVLRRGDALEKEWWWVRNRRGETGYVPCNYLGNYPRIAAEV